MGELFRDTQKELQEKTLYERIEMMILKIISELLEILSIDVEDTIYRLISSEKATEEVIVMLIAVNQYKKSTPKHYLTYYPKKLYNSLL